MVVVLTGPSGEVRCRVNDTGGFVVPHAFHDGAQTVAVERAQATPFVAMGLDTTEVLMTMRAVAGIRY